MWHAELIVEQLGLTDANIVSSLGTATLTPLTADDEEIDEEAELLGRTRTSNNSARDHGQWGRVYVYM